MFRTMTGWQRLMALRVRKNQARRREERSYTARFERWAKKQHGTLNVSGSEIIGRGEKRVTKAETEAAVRRLLRRKPK